MSGVAQPPPLPAASIGICCTGANALAAWPWLYLKLEACSVPARLLLAVLVGRRATSAAAAITDKLLAEYVATDEMRISERTIIDLAGELTEAGFCCCAQTVPPYGRWIVLPDGDLEPARKYQADLNDRARKIHKRAGDLRRSIELYEQHARPAESTGQLQFLIPAPDVPAKPTAARLAEFCR